MSNKINEIKKYLEEDAQEITPDELDKELEGYEKNNWEGKWFLIQAFDFGNYDKKTKVLKSEIGKSWKQKQIDENGNPILDENGEETFKKIDKDWTEIAVPFSKGSEFIRVKNTRISGTKNNFYYKIVLNTKAKTMPIYTLTGKKIQDMDMKEILKKFEAHEKSLISYIEKYKKEQELQNLNKDLSKGKEKEKSR